MTATEFNFDGLVGPTHNYAGLSSGNIASKTNKGNVSNPKQAARQGLRKMKALHDLGVPQAVLPPQERPCISFLKQCGFSGADKHIIELASIKAPDLLQAACSASAMWTANAATISPSADTTDGKLHMTPANLVNKLHRSIEDETTFKILDAIFNDSSKFTLHDPLPHHQSLGDEGAANHTRFCSDYDSTGLELFVYGQTYFDSSSPHPTHYPARQTKEASQCVIRSHQVKNSSSMLIQQNPQVIDRGVFHNDVIAVGNQNVLLYHQQAFCNDNQLESKISGFFGGRIFYFIRVANTQISVDEAIKTYLFNSQVITLPDQSMAMIVPQECQDNDNVRNFLQELINANNPINALIVKDLRESMSNGGGPACLRLRIVLTDSEASAINQHVILNEKLYNTLDLWIDNHYRDRLDNHSLTDPQLLDESRAALDELTKILNLGSVYPFQN